MQNLFRKIHPEQLTNERKAVPDTGIKLVSKATNTFKLQTGNGKTELAQ